MRSPDANSKPTTPPHHRDETAAPLPRRVHLSPRVFEVIASLAALELGSRRCGSNAISQSRGGRREAPIRPSFDRVGVRVRSGVRSRGRVRVRVKVKLRVFEVIASLAALELGSRRCGPNAISQSRGGRREAPIWPILKTRAYSDSVKVTPLSSSCAQHDGVSMYAHLRAGGCSG